jgi:hypothetical protein
MKRWFSLVSLLLPLSTFAQLPIPLTPDWLKAGGDKSFGVLNSTHVTLTENNYMIVETNVVAKSKGFKLLGLISIKSASYTKAMTDLYARAQVKQGHPQALANVVYESSSTYLILFSIPKVTIRADLIEFVGTAKLDEARPPVSRAPVSLSHQQRRPEQRLRADPSRFDTHFGAR